MVRLLVVLTVAVVMMSTSVRAEQQRLFIASAGKPSSIETCTFDSETGQFGEVTTAVADVQTGFMALHPKLPILYAAVAEKVPRGQMNGAVYAYRINTETGELKQLAFPWSCVLPALNDVLLQHRLLYQMRLQRLSLSKRKKCCIPCTPNS